jgi:hypothetical protein
VSAHACRPAVRRLTVTLGAMLVGAALVILSSSAAAAAWRTAGSGGANITSGTIGAAEAPSTSIAGDMVTLSWTPLELLGPLLVTDRATLVGYRQVGGTEDGPFTLGAACTDTTATTCTQPQPVGETWRYAVIVALGPWTGAQSTPGSAVTVTDPPTSSVTFPGGGVVNAAGWDAACADSAGVCGSAAPGADGAAITRVEVRITDPDGRSLDGAGSWVAGEVWRTVLDRTPAAAGEPAALDWSLAMPASALGPDGTYTVTVRVGDAAGWQAVVGTPGSVVVDRVAPVTTSDAPAVPQPTATTVTFSATDERSGVASTEYRTSTDAVSFSAWTTGTSVQFTSSATHTVQFRSTDVAGNVEAPRTATVTVDTTPPTVTLTAPADATTVLSRTAVTLSATASHPLFAITSVQFSWSRDGSSWTPIGGPVTVPLAGVYSTVTTSPHLPAGTLQLRATAMRTGGVEGASTTRSITVRPEVVSVALVNGGTAGTADPGDSIVITFTDALDPTSVCSSFTSTSGPFTHSDLTVVFSGNPNVVTISATGSCGTSGFGSVQVGGNGNGRYTSGGGTLSFSGSSITWDPATLQLRLTLGPTQVGTAAVGTTASAIYSPGALTSGSVGLPAATTSTADQRF